MWRIISFHDNDGNVIEHLATQKSINYFDPSNNPHVCVDNIRTEVLAFTIEAELNNPLNNIPQ